MIEPIFSKLKKEASKNGTLYGKPKKGTKPLPARRPKVEGQKKKAIKKKPKATTAAAKKPAKK
jgi:hypothetical protein